MAWVGGLYHKGTLDIDPLWHGLEGCITRVNVSKNRVFLENSVFDLSWRLKDMACSNFTFQELISHWSLSSHSNGLQYQIGLGLSFPKWYDTCIFVEKWPHNGLKHEE